MKSGKKTLLILTLVFVLTELTSLYIVLTDLNGDPLGGIVITSFFLLLILLFSKRIAWARWMLSILLILYGLLYLASAYELMITALYLIGLYDVFFAIFIHKSKSLEEFRNKKPELNQQAENSRTEYGAAVVVQTQENTYPLLIKRYKALLIDAVFLLTILIAIMVLTQENENNTIIMVSSAVILLLAYEPLLTAYSKTIGQRIMKIKVRKHDNPQMRISLINAYLRWVTKGFLGWISFITINFNPEHRAIHDLASDSVMINEE